MTVRNPVRAHERVKQIFAKKDDGVGNSMSPEVAGIIRRSSLRI
jgi:hypothetical protein